MLGFSFLHSCAKYGYRAACSQATPLQLISECVEKSSNTDMVSHFPCAVGGWALIVMGGGEQGVCDVFMARKGIKSELPRVL